MNLAVILLRQLKGAHLATIINGLRSKKQRQQKLLSHRVTCRPLPENIRDEDAKCERDEITLKHSAIQRFHEPNFLSQMISPRQTCVSGSAYTDKKTHNCRSKICYLLCNMMRRLCHSDY